MNRAIILRRVRIARFRCENQNIMAERSQPDCRFFAIETIPAQMIGRIEVGDKQNSHVQETMG